MSQPLAKQLPWTLAGAVAGLHCIGDLMRFARSRLAEGALDFRSGMGSAAAEAAFLLGESLSLDAEELEGFAAARLLESERRAILEALAQRLETRKPMAYILKATWYCGHRLAIDERALIPRSSIGTMLEDYFSLEDPQSPRRILDLGTGSGAIAIAFAHAFPAARILATDLSQEALELAASNIALHRLADRIETRCSHLFDTLGDRRFDWILCNPPYVSEDFKEVMAPEYHHEPDLALFGGTDGMDFICPLLRSCATYLEQEGKIFIEFGDITGQRFRQRFPEAGGEWYCHPESGRPVVLILERAECQRLAARIEHDGKCG